MGFRWKREYQQYVYASRQHQPQRDVSLPEKPDRRPEESWNEGNMKTRQKPPKHMTEEEKELQRELLELRKWEARGPKDKSETGRSQSSRKLDVYSQRHWRFSDEFVNWAASVDKSERFLIWDGLPERLSADVLEILAHRWPKTALGRARHALPVKLEAECWAILPLLSHVEGSECVRAYTGTIPEVTYSDERSRREADLLNACFVLMRSLQRAHDSAVETLRVPFVPDSCGTTQYHHDMKGVLMALKMLGLSREAAARAFEKVDHAQVAPNGYDLSYLRTAATEVVQHLDGIHEEAAVRLLRAASELGKSYFPGLHDPAYYGSDPVQGVYYCE